MSTEWVGLNELRAAIKRNPQKTLDETKKFLTRGMAEYKRGIIRAPWRIGGSGGGAPVATGNLRDTHVTKIETLQAFIGPNTTAVPYAVYVHDGTRRMQGRPWLNYVKEAKAGAIQELYRQLLNNIVSDLAT